MLLKKRRKTIDPQSNRTQFSPSLAARETHASVLSPDLLYTEMGKPFSATLRARFWPMTARPMRPTVDMLAEGEELKKKDVFFPQRERRRKRSKK